MPKYVALFRGINVGKAKRIAMADLRKLLEKMGFTDVRTLLNSGNAVFATRTTTPATLSRRIRTEVANVLGVDAQVVVKSGAEVATIMAENGLSKHADDPSRLLVLMDDDPAAIAAWRKVARQDWGAERVHVGSQAAYLWCANGILESQAIEALFRALEGRGTSRNWGTMNKIAELLRDES